MFLIILTFIIGGALLYFFNNYKKANIYIPQGENIIQTASVETSQTFFDKTQLSDFTRSFTNYFDIRSKVSANSGIQKETTNNLISIPTEISTSFCSTLPPTQENTISPTTTTIQAPKNQDKISLNKLISKTHGASKENKNSSEIEKYITKKTPKQSLEWSSNEILQLDPASKAAEDHRLKLLEKRHEKLKDKKKMHGVKN